MVFCVAYLGPLPLTSTIVQFVAIGVRKRCLCGSRLNIHILKKKKCFLTVTNYCSA